MKQILVTGAAGFIGSKICEFLLRDGAQVVGIDNMNPGYDPRLKEYRLRNLQEMPGFDFIRGDITDNALLDRIFTEHSFDAVINIAGVPGVRLSVENPWIFLETNTTGCLNLLEQCRKHAVRKFIQASTSSIYGENAPQPIPETADTNHPLQPYAVSKKGAETMCYAYHYLYGIDVTVLRFFTVYGPAGRPDMAMFRFIQWIAEGQTLQVNGDGEQTRGFTYVDDIALGTILALKDVGYEIINLGGHERISINALIRKLETIIGRKAVTHYQPIFKADMLANLADISKAHSLLGWDPAIGLAEGLERTVAWYRRERDWLSDIRL